MRNKIPENWNDVIEGKGKEYFNIWFLDWETKTGVSAKAHQGKKSVGNVLKHLNNFIRLGYLEGPRTVKKWKKWKGGKILTSRDNCYRGNSKSFLDYAKYRGTRLTPVEKALIENIIIIFPELRKEILKNENVIEGFKNILTSLIITPIDRGIRTFVIADDLFYSLFSSEKWRENRDWKRRLTPNSLIKHIKKVRKKMDEEYPKFVSSSNLKKINKERRKLKYDKVDAIMAGIKRIYPIEYTDALAKVILPKRFVEAYLRKYKLNEKLLKHI